MPVTFDIYKQLKSNLQFDLKTKVNPSKAKFLAQLAKEIFEKDQDILSRIQWLIDTEVKEYIELSLLLMPKTENKKFYKTIIKYCDSDDWEIREYAGEALGEFLKPHLNNFYRDIIELRKKKSENIRRGAVLAMKYLAKYRIPEYRKKIFDILGYFLDDDREYVKKNLGPFAIGDALIIYYPEETISFIKRYSKSKKSTVKWNICMIFSSASGSKHYDVAMPILIKNIYDNDAIVRNAAMKALRQIYTRHPETREKIKSVVDKNLEKFQYSKSIINFIQ